jgi:hypothetical protein
MQIKWMTCSMLNISLWVAMETVVYLKGHSCVVLLSPTSLPVFEQQRMKGNSNSVNWWLCSQLCESSCPSCRAVSTHNTFHFTVLLSRKLIAPLCCSELFILEWCLVWFDKFCRLDSGNFLNVLSFFFFFSSFKLFLELEPQLRDIIFKFYESKYASCLKLLDEIKVRFYGTPVIHLKFSFPECYGTVKKKKHCLRSQAHTVRIMLTWYVWKITAHKWVSHLTKYKVIVLSDNYWVLLYFLLVLMEPTQPDKG